MSEQAKKNDRRWLGKLRTSVGQYGQMFNILMDNISPVNEKDGTPNQYFKGMLVWCDASGKQYQVKQLGMSVPKDGMKPADAAKGYTAVITLDLENNYQVIPLN
jgi:hypothetical protein